MGGKRPLQMALLAGGAAAAMLLGASVALAQHAAPGEINLNDPATALAEGVAVDLSVRSDSGVRVMPLSPIAQDESADQRRLELELAAGGEHAPLDVSLAQRATLGADSNGDLSRSGRGSELRIGRNLVGEREQSNQPSVYMFVASEDEALTWQPGARSEFGGSGGAFAMQDRVEVGDLSAGVTYERNGVQASLAYVERSESTRVGNQSFSQDQSFAGVTVTMRR